MRMLRTRPDMIRTIKCLSLTKPYMNLALGFGMPMSVIVEYPTRREQIVITKCASAASDNTATLGRLPTYHRQHSLYTSSTVLWSMYRLEVHVASNDVKKEVTTKKTSPDHLPFR